MDEIPNPSAVLKHLLAGLVGGGCRVDLVSHRPAAVTFRSPGGEPTHLLIANTSTFVLAAPPEHPQKTAIYRTLSDAVRAACRPEHPRRAQRPRRVRAA